MSDDNTAKIKALQLTLDKLDKTYGKGTVMKLGDEVVVETEAISSGSLGLDIALGVGGYPRGRVIEIYGPCYCQLFHKLINCISKSRSNCCLSRVRWSNI